MVIAIDHKRGMFETDVMWRRSQSRRIFTSMICLSWGVCMKILGFDMRAEKWGLVLSMGRERKLDVGSAYYMTRRNCVCRNSVQQG